MAKLSRAFAYSVTIVCALVLGQAGARALDEDGEVGDGPVEAPVVMFNRTIAVFREPFLGLTPAVRAARTERSLHELLDAGGPGVVTVQEAPQGNLVMLDGSLALILTPGDVDKLRGETFAGATEAVVAALQHLVEDTREARDRTRVLRAIGLSLIATVVLVLAWTVVWRMRRWLVDRWAGALQARVARLRLAGEQIVHASWLATIARGLARMLTWFALAGLCYEWLSFVLAQFPYTRVWSDRLDDNLFAIGSRVISKILRALPDLAIALFIFATARGLLSAVRPFFERMELSEQNASWLDRDTARPTRKVVTVLVWAFAVVMAYPYIPGSSSEAFKGVSVLLGVMATLGGSSLFGQAASGMILMYSRSLRVGEYVRIHDAEGTVTELNTFTTKLRTGLGEEIVFANSAVLSAMTKNYSRVVRGRGYILDTAVTIGYDTPWRQVEAMLVEAAGNTDGVLAEPPPRVFATALSDFYVEYRLVCQAVPSEPRPRAELLSTLHSQVLDTFNRYGVQIMSPHYLADPAAAKLVPKEQWFPAPVRKPKATAP